MSNEKLNTKDLKSGLNYVVTRGSGEKVSAKDFDVIFKARAAAAGLVPQNSQLDAAMSSDLGKQFMGKAKHMLDADGDGEITTKDFELMFNNQMKFIDANQTQIDRYLPFIGQCTFGIFCGWSVGYVSRSLMTYKMPLGIVGFAGYSGFQYLAQQNYINQEVMKVAFEQKIMQLIDVNKDGMLDKDDVEALIEQKMAIVNTKLGPGGFAPGLAGYCTFSLGMMRGMRII